MFDEAKLASMNEPFNIRVERLKNNTRSPITLPEGEADPETGQPRPGGVGWSRDEVRKLEEYLLTSLTGGGLYEITITDSSEPNAQVMKWQPFWDPKLYPERMPSTMADAAREPVNTSFAPGSLQPLPTLQVARTMAQPAFPNGFPTGFAPQTPGVNTVMYTPSYQMAPQMPPAPPIGSPHYPTWQNEAQRLAQDSELRALRERDAAREREAMEAKHQAELRAERSANEQRYSRQDQQITDLKNMVATLASSVKETMNAKPAGPDPQIEALRRDAERAAAERDAERRETAQREMLREIREANQKQIDTVMRMIEQLNARIAEAGASKHDPLVTMLQEQSRQHAETLREITRGQATAVEKMVPFMMAPRDMIEMVQKQSAATDASADRIANQFGRVMDLQQKVTENALSMAPQGSGVVDVVREGVAGLKDFGEKWVTSKTMEQKLAVTSQVQMAQAAAVMAQAQAAQSQAQAGMNGMPTSGPTVHTPPPPRVEEQLPAAKRVERLWGRTDDEWFGPILEEVETTREAVVEKKLGVEEVANGIIYATDQITKMGTAIPAIIELLIPGHLAEFMSILLPDAPVEFRDAVIKSMRKQARAAAGIPDEDDAGVEDDADDDDVDEDDGADEDAPDQSPKAVKPTIKVVKSGNGKPARA